MTGRGVVESNKNPVNWVGLSLQAGGRSLIEASAGTGKTWTISVLYLRLLLEQEFSPKQIIVTTFTDAAAQELRERIRSRLLWAEQKADAVIDLRDQKVFDAGSSSPDEQWLTDRWQDDSATTFDLVKVRADLNRLRLASAELDLAPIGTLHSLCRKILTDYPFESGSTFDLGEMVSTDNLITECANDLWRRLHQGEQVADGDDQGDFVPGTLSDTSKRLKAYLSPGVALRVPDEQELYASLTEDRAAQIEAFAARTEMYALTPTGKPKQTLRNALVSLAGWIRDPTQLLSTTHRGTLAKLDTELNAEHWEKLQASPELNLLSETLSVFDQVAWLPEARTWAKWVGEARASNQQRLAAAGQLTFDELIERVHRALPAGGNALADRLFDSWPVAMVDEFQDTDVQQFAILDRIYRDRDRVHRGRLVMIGDPKQAIYRFRGGDIDAYLEARKTATNKLTLDTNFRSSRQLVSAFNAFYAQAGEVLSSASDHEICYEAVNPSGRCDAEPYRVNGVICEQPLQFHYWDSEVVPADSAGRKKIALESCANHIVELLSAGNTIGKKPVRPGDIAVLLPSNAQITTLRELLSVRDVPCVSSAKSSVFSSDWARELQIILYAALHPRDEGAVRAALATRLIGKTYKELRDLRDEPEAWQREASVFSQLDHLWQTRGVLALVQQLTSAARSRLFTRSDSERTLTDLRHLGELLQACSEKLTGREQLLAWLADQRDDEGDEAGDAADEMQLRIESDAARVRLMTLHASKGLEFPIVMLPLMWANKHSHQDTISILHDEIAEQRVVAFGADAKKRYQQEGQDERFRLLYVALTRARYACHVYALNPARPANAKSKNPDTDPSRAPLDTMIERLLKSGEPTSMANVLWSSGEWSWPMKKYQPVVEAVEVERLVLKEPDATSFEFKYSFSALAKGGKITPMEERAASDENQAEDERLDLPDTSHVPDAPEGNASAAEELAETEHAQLQWLAPIAGADFGNALHAIFEHRVIGRPMADQHALIQRCVLDEGVYLAEISIDELVPHLANRIQVSLDTPLLPESDPTLTLGALPESALCAEMEFNFVLGEVSLRRLREVCDFVPGKSMHTLRGLMNGKIDLVFEHDGRFHVLDYKGNRLDDGADSRNYAFVSNYAPARLERAMDHSNYRFQALLYTVAIDRYLRQRMPHYDRSKHLGETIYLFVRAIGIAPEIVPSAGIWAHRFDDVLIDAVDAVFATEVREAA